MSDRLITMSRFEQDDPWDGLYTCEICKERVSEDELERDTYVCLECAKIKELEE